MRASQIKLGAEYYVCRYPARYHIFDISPTNRMDERDWQHFADAATRVRVLEKKENMHSGYLCEMLTLDTGEVLPEPSLRASFRSAQIMALWHHWEHAYLDHFQIQDDQKHARHLKHAKEKLASAERSATYWRDNALKNACQDLEYASQIFKVRGDISNDMVLAYIELQHPNGNPYDEDIAEASARLTELEEST